MLRHGFRELDLHKVQLTVLDYSERALNIYRRVGFQQEGAFREFVYRDGERRDMILMGMLAKEWCEGQRNGSARSGGERTASRRSVLKNMYSG